MEVIMMSKVKVMLLSLLAMSVIGATASASASALIWYQCSKNPGGSGPKYATQANCESLTASTGEWEWLPLLATAAAPLLVPSKGVGSQKLSFSSGAAAIECNSLKDSADLWNKGGNGKDLLLEEVFTGCTVTKPSGCGVVHSPGEPNGTIKFAPLIPSRLVTKEGVTYDEFEQNANEELVTIDLEGSEGSGKPCGVVKLTNKLKGSFLGKIRKMSKLIEFEAGSGENELKYEGNDEQGAEAGMVPIFAE
jgi:hypothetical protein